jgi:hypothetical protein
VSPGIVPILAENPGFARNEGEIRRETDCLLEGDGFELSVPRNIMRPVRRVSWLASATALSTAASNTRRPAVKCSMITARIAGFSWYQSPAPSFVTVIKSAPRKTPVTSGRENSRSASGDS